ncbi:MAG: Ig-like domain-containing protein [Phycisphaerales bacterium]|nr:Ig-like domain-containing protein [Phycisphaerales bacterium]
MKTTMMRSIAVLGWALGVGALAAIASNTDQKPSVANMPAVVVQTVPQAGDTAVDAKTTTEIRVTFSKKMTDKTWSWSQVSDDSFPEVTGEIHFDKDGKTCICPVKLEPGKTYATWLNSGKFKNFKDDSGIPSVPYLLVFETK